MLDLFSTRNRHHGISIADRIDATGDCWLWCGSLKGNGYGEVSVDGVRSGVHRVVYEALVGPIPEGLQIDHLCRVRHCVNPDHLEPVTPGENIRRGQTGAHERRKTHCPQGHAYSPENTYRRVDGHRHCRTCVLKQQREAYRVRRLEAAAT